MMTEIIGKSTVGIDLHTGSRICDGSLRQAATEAGAAVLLFEGGEASRFDPAAIRAAADGVLRVLRSLNVIAPEAAPASTPA